MVSTTVTEFKRKSKHYFDIAIKDKEPIIIKAKDRYCVLMDKDEYDSWSETIYINKSPAMVKRIEESKKQARNKKKLTPLSKIIKALK